MVISYVYGANRNEMKNSKEAIRPGGLYTVLTKDSKSMEKWQEKGKRFWASRVSKLWESKYVGETNGR